MTSSPSRDEPGRFQATTFEARRALVLEVLCRPLAHESLGDGQPGVPVAHLARIAGLSIESTQHVLDSLVADGTLERDAQHRYTITVEGHAVAIPFSPTEQWREHMGFPKDAP